MHLTPNTLEFIEKPTKYILAAHVYVNLSITVKWNLKDSKYFNCFFFACWSIVDLFYFIIFIDLLSYYLYCITKKKKLWSSSCEQYCFLRDIFLFTFLVMLYVYYLLIKERMVLFYFLFKVKHTIIYYISTLLKLKIQMFFLYKLNKF